MWGTKGSYVTPFEPPEDLYGMPPEYQIFDDVDLGILLVSEDFTVIRANTAFRRLAGGEPIEVPGEAAGRIRAAAGDGIPEFECRLRAPDGRERRYRCSGRRVPSGVGWLLLFREMPGDYEAIVEYTGTATILIEGDGTISVANTEFERLSGYTLREIVGIKRLPEFIASEDERRRIMGYHTLRRRAPSAAPKNYSFTFIDRSSNLHAVEVTIGLIPGTARSVMSLLDVTERRRAEQALQESEERLNLALLAANDGLVDWDVSTGRIFYSPRNFTMLGYEPGAFALTIPRILALVHPEDRGRVEAALADMITGERDHCKMEFRARSASGEWFYVLDRLRVVKHDGSGMPLRIVGTHSDITERKQAEKELLVREMAMESSLSAIAIADLEGRLTYANQALLAMGGLTDPGQVLGRNISEFWVEPERVAEVLRTLAERGRCTGELVGRRADGAHFTAHVTVNVVSDGSGSPVCIMATVIDITEKRRMEEALRESEERYRTLAESAPDIIFLVSTKGDALYVNGAGGRLLGVEPESLRGKNLRDLFPPAVAERWLAKIRIVAERAGGILTEETLLPGDGGGTWLETRLIPMVGSDGIVRSLLGISRDVTGRKQAEEQLRFQALVLSQVEDAVTAFGTGGRVTYMNQAAERLYGVPLSEAIGRPGSEFFTCEWLHPDDNEAVKNALRASGTWHGVVLHRKRNGETIFVDETLSTLTGEDGKSTGTLCSLRDVTAPGLGYPQRQRVLVRNALLPPRCYRTEAGRARTPDQGYGDSVIARCRRPHRPRREDHLRQPCLSRRARVGAGGRGYRGAVLDDLGRP